MKSRRSPQSRFLLQASLLLVAMLAIWWFVLLEPLRVALRVSTSLLISPTGAAWISTDTEGNWELPMRAPRGSRQAGRTIRLRIPQRIPNLFTMSLPFYWAIILAAPRSKRFWSVLGIGTVALALLGPPSLMLYAGFTARNALFPDSSGIAWWRFGSYLGTSVIPYIMPAVLALFLHPELRQLILRGELSEIVRTARKPRPSRSRRTAKIG